MPSLNLDSMTWRSLSTLLERALALPHPAREGWIRSLPESDQHLVPQLQALLAHDQEGGTPALLATLPKLISTTVGPTVTLGAGGSDVGVSIGPYQLIRLLGEGGMGHVWLAERTDGILNRPVALKLPRIIDARPELPNRLEREREILASLNHPHIAKIFDAGLTDAGQPYLALEYIEGRPIDVYCRANELSIRNRVELLLQVAGALGHAHQRLIIHRDVKPSNILVTEEDETRLLDFGIAKLIEPDDANEEDVTHPHRVALTLGYASPEQIRGERLTVGTDVFSLGVVAYELLTGQRPWGAPGRSRPSLKRAILFDEIKKPSDVAPEDRRSSLRGDLDTIVLKALKKEPGERYERVEAFEEDLKRYLEGRPVLARPDSVAYRVRKFAGRHRLASILALILVAVIIEGVAVALWQASVAIAERDRAEAVKDFIVALFREADPYADGSGTLSAVGLLKQAPSRIDRELPDRPYLQAELRSLVGEALIGLNAISDAEAVLAKSVDEARSSLGANHIETLRLKVKLASAYRASGKAAEMEALLSKTIPGLSRLGDARDRVAGLMAQTHLALTQARFADAQRLGAEGHAVALSAFGDSDLDTVVTGVLYAVAVQLGGGASEALAIAEEAYERSRLFFDGHDKHPLAVEANAIYARALAKAGRPAEAIPRLESVVRYFREALGPKSRQVGFYSSDLAVYREQVGDLAGARQAIDEGLSVLEAALAPSSYVLGVSSYRRGRIHLAARRFAEAEASFSRSVRILCKALGDEHARTVRSRQFLALARAVVGRFDEAEVALKATATSSTPQAHFVGGRIDRLAGRYPSAIRAQQLALSRLQGGRPDDRQRIDIFREIGLAELELGALDRARRHLEAGLVLHEALKIRMTPDWTEVLVGLGRIHLARGDASTAERVLLQANAFRQKQAPGSRWAQVSADWLAKAKRVSQAGKTAPASLVAR